MEGDPQRHLLLSCYHKQLASYNGEIAAYHWRKFLDPLSEEPIPPVPPAITYFRDGDIDRFIENIEPCNTSTS